MDAVAPHIIVRNDRLLPEAPQESPFWYISSEYCMHPAPYDEYDEVP